MKKIIYVSVNCCDLQNLLKVYQNHENHSNYFISTNFAV